MTFHRSWIMTRAVGLTLASCLVIAVGAVGPTQVRGATQLKVAMLFSAPVTGNSWDGNGYRGLQSIKQKAHAKVAYTESVQLADIQQALRNYATQGYDLIFGNGFEYGQPMSQIASQFPKVKFVAITGASATPSNLQEPQFAENQAGYLAGIVAGLMTKSNKIGCVGGQQLPFVVSQLEGFKLGVKRVNKRASVHVTYTGSFTDVAKAKQASTALVDTGVDVLCQKDDNGGPAIIGVAKSRHIWAIGDSEDQNNLAPKTVLTSAIIHSPAVILAIARQVMNGTFKSGKPYYGVKQHAAGLSSYHGLVPTQVAKRVTQVENLIAQGKINVPLITKPSNP
jgi:basic membrane protein A and related proteins